MERVGQKGGRTMRGAFEGQHVRVCPHLRPNLTPRVSCPPGGILPHFASLGPSQQLESGTPGPSRRRHIGCCLESRPNRPPPRRPKTSNGRHPSPSGTATTPSPSCTDWCHAASQLRLATRCLTCPSKFRAAQELDSELPDETGGLLPLWCAGEFVLGYGTCVELDVPQAKEMKFPKKFHP